MIETLPAELVTAVATKGGFGLGFCLLSFTVFSLREKIGIVLEARATARSWKAVEIGNGKLADRLAKSVAPIMESAIDNRFREMPEFMREKISAIVADKMEWTKNELLSQSKQLDDLNRSLGDVARIVSHIEGRLDK